MRPLYTYNATITKIIDGDTVDAEIDLGFNISTVIRFRLMGIDTAELRSSDPAMRELAIKAKVFMQQYLNQKVSIQSFKTEKYGRWLAEIYIFGTARTINQLLIENNLASPYFVGSRP